MDRIYATEQKVRRFMEAHGTDPAKDLRVTAAVSGGADSVAMLLILQHLLGAGDGCSLQAVHVEHGIRGEESAGDADFVRALCVQEGIPLTVRHVDVPAFAAKEHLSTEEAARILRYRAIREVSSGGVIAVAHNMDDNAETMLLQIARGTGWKGAAGLPCDNGRGVLRPLLCLRREEIEAYLQARGQTWRRDSTNADLKITRNRIRMEIMPVLSEVNPRFREHFLETAETVRAAGENLAGRAEELLRSLTAEDPAVLDRKALKMRFKGNDRDPLLLELMHVWLSRILPMTGRDLSSDQILHAASIAAGPSGKMYCLPGGWRVRAEHERLVCISPLYEKAALW